ncbi:hypothetical protein BC332_32058 [Capsicum chinense]|nr:hypothetical protein BC332_32058 [Capsicum chinense]
MPLNVDQFLTAKYVVELGIALEVGRDENVRLERKEIAKSIRNVIVEKKGEDLRAKSGELSEKIRIKEKKDIEEEAVEELRKLCLMNKKEKIVEERSGKGRSSVAPGHAKPFFEFAKKLSKHKFHIYLCSTSAVLNFSNKAKKLLLVIKQYM